MRFRALILALALASVTVPAAAQVGDGGLRGTVVDEQGGAMPGVTVTATSSALMAPAVAISESDGTYRLINLPPGEYVLSAELAGFTAFRREGVLLRAGANFQVDITMTVGAMEETITVTGDSPMLEVSKPSNVLTIDAEFQKRCPIVEGKFWSDFLLLTPGSDLASAQRRERAQNYFGNAVEHRDAVTLMEGMYAGNYNDFNINRTGLSSEAIQDTEVKTGGVDAASPMGYGLVINMVSKSGGNKFQGTGRVGVSAVLVEREQRGGRHAGDPRGASVRRLARRTRSSATGRGSSRRCGTPTTRAERAERPISWPTCGRSSPRSPWAQHHGRLPAVGQGDHEDRPETRSRPHLPGGSPAAESHRATTSSWWRSSPAGARCTAPS